jgi:hypothetical protein
MDGSINISRRVLIAATAAGAIGASSAGKVMAAEQQGVLPENAMNFGECPDDKPLRDSWKAFLRRLEEAGEYAFKAYNPPTSPMRADAFRFMLQNLGQSFALGFETKDTKYPVIHTFCTPWCKLGGDNADCVYQQAWIDGESVYKISGNKGTVRYFSIAVQGAKAPPRPNWRPLADPFGDIPEASIFGHQLEADWDGEFELYIGGPKRGPNWVPTTPGTRKLFIRQYFDDFSEVPARIRIERVDMTTPRPVPMAKDIEKALDWMGTFVRQTMIDFPDWGYEFVRDVDPNLINKFPWKQRDFYDPAYNEEKDKLRNRSGVAMRWKIAPDEALILEWDKNDVFWMLTNMGVFMNSMDYLYRPISWTPSRTKVDSDGKIRFVMAHDDPGYHNWIDCQGFPEGLLENRNVFTTGLTEIRTNLVKRAELATAMPADAAKVTYEERSHQMLERFHAIEKRYML